MASCAWQQSLALKASGQEEILQVGGNISVITEGRIVSHVHNGIRDLYHSNISTGNFRYLNNLGTLFSNCINTYFCLGDSTVKTPTCL